MTQIRDDLTMEEIDRALVSIRRTKRMELRLIIWLIFICVVQLAQLPKVDKESVALLMRIGVASEAILLMWVSYSWCDSIGMIRQLLAAKERLEKLKKLTSPND